MNTINSHNVLADQETYGKWAEFGSDYFTNPEIIDELWRLFSRSYAPTRKKVNLLELGAAEGTVGEYFTATLGKSNDVTLTIVDIVKQHLEKNRNPKTIKRQENALSFHPTEKYDVIIVRSLLHYFSHEDQLIVLRNIRQALTSEGVLFLTAFIQRPEALNLFLQLNRMVGKKLELLNERELLALLKSAGFQTVQCLGDTTTWNCSSQSLQKRYRLSKEIIQKMRALIEQSADHTQAGFTLSSNGFTVPIPFRAYVCRV